MNRSGQFWINLCIAAIVSAAAIYLIFYYLMVNNHIQPAASEAEVTQAPLASERQQTRPENSLRVYHDRQPPYVVYKGGPRVYLANNAKAHDPTWQELKDFIKSDGTDSKTYDRATFPCGAFAEEVHNNAEAHGIRAAWVAIDFEDETEGHAINAFETTDFGLVYVDCTGDRSKVTTHKYSASDKGRTFGNASSCDRIAYVQVGKEYGIISLEVAGSPEYIYYVQYKNSLAKFESDLAAYNSDSKKYDEDVTRFNQFVSGRTMNVFSVDYARANQWKDQLTGELRDLEQRAKILDSTGDNLGAFWEPKGTVKSVEIYW
jgi:hypothetical protein